MLFENFQRNNSNPRERAEPLFDFLNRSSRASSEQVRDLLNGWFQHYPEDHKNELKSRFCSSNDTSHQSAFFELYMHELLSKMGYQITVHPDISSRATHPEFLVSKGGNPVFFLECTLSVGSEEEVSTETRENTVYDTINRMKSPNFFIEVKVKGSPKTSPPGAKWRKFLENKLSSLNPNDYTEQIEKGDLDSLPSWTRNHDGWEVMFRAIPKSSKARNKPGIRPIGISWIGATWCKDHENIRKSVKAKAGKYGEFEIPYIITVNSISHFTDDIDIENALFGDENVTVYRLPYGGFHQKPGRHRNGVLLGPKGPQYTRVSAVLIFKYLLWGNITKEIPVLWHNPWATNPFDPEEWPFPQKVIDTEGKVTEKEKTRNITELLGILEDWPDYSRDK